MGGGLTIIKLGGSVITDKSIPYKLEERNIYHIALDIKSYGKGDIILLHGGGSVGHYLVEAFKLHQPSKQIPPLHVATLSMEMDKLTNKIVEIFIEVGIPVMSVPTHAVVSANAGVPKVVDLSPVKNMLSGGYMPLMRGDVVPDSEKGFSILSGDDLSVLLASELGVSRVIFLMDVEGIIGPDGKVIKKLRSEEFNESLIWPANGKFDVTGGLRKKLDVMKVLAEKGIRVFILSPKIKGRLLNALSDKPFLGTEVIC